MAEAGTYLTSTTTQTPSIFDIIAQESFSTSLNPALEYLAKFLASTSPPNFGFLYRRFDEIYLGLNVLIQYYYLKTKGGTLGETFYELERVLGPPNKPTSVSDSKMIFKWSLLTSTLLPYIRIKLDKLKDVYLDQLSSLTLWDSSPIPLTPDQILTKTCFIKIYRALTGVWKSIQLASYILFALRKTRSHSLTFFILGLNLSYSNNDIDNDAKKKAVSKSLFRWYIFTLGDSVLMLLEASSFIFQFLEWLKNEKQTVKHYSSPTPPPYKNGLKLDKQLCPLCNQIRRSNTTLRTSGIVYCYSCITEYLEEYQKCPLTRVPSTFEHLIRIY